MCVLCMPRHTETCRLAFLTTWVRWAVNERYDVVVNEVVEMVGGATC